MASLKIEASEHPLASVTIFKSAKAEVVRTFKLSLGVSLSLLSALAISQF